jgi:hypothetical protein
MCAFRNLSDRWVHVAEEMLRSESPAARWAIPVENLDHLEVRCTRAQGSGIVGYYANGHLASSALLLSGQNSAVEKEIQQMFLSSLPGSPGAFVALDSMHVRPVQAIAIWGNPNVSESDYGLLRDFSLHFAGAFFRRNSSVPNGAKDGK